VSAPSDPHVRVERVVPKRVQAHTVAVVEPYGEGVDVHEWCGTAPEETRTILKNL